MVELTVIDFEARHLSDGILLKIYDDNSVIIRQILENGYQEEMEDELRKWRKEMEKEGHD